MAVDGGWEGAFGGETVNLELRWAGLYIERAKSLRKSNVLAGLSGFYGWTRLETFGNLGLDRFAAEGLGGRVWAGAEIPRQGGLRMTARSGWTYFNPQGAWDGSRAAAAGITDRQYDLGGFFWQWGVNLRF